MSEEKKNWLGPYIPEGSAFRELLQQAKLAFNLMTDARVNPLAKLIPVGALAYLFFPIDISPDVIPLLGQIDDVGIFILGMRLFFEFSPPEVVREHLRRLAENVQWKVDETPPAGTPPKGEIVEGSFSEALQDNDKP